jgi:hypothetical protein
MNWSATDLAYLAGFIDGEGSICIFTSRVRGYRRDHLRLDVYNTDEATLLWIQSTFGGRVHKVKQRAERVIMTWKQEYTWTAGPKHAAQVLKGCLPFLKGKRKQAELFIQHQATSNRNGHRTPTDVLAVRDAIIEQLKSLNRRGSAARQPDGAPR